MDGSGLSGYLGFRGEVTDFYQRFRRGYPPAVIDHLVGAFALTHDDVALDVGCGTGQLTLPLAERVRAAVGLDPEPDMLARARAAARDRRARNVSWLLGADTDVPALRALFGGHRPGAVTIAQALHWMDHDTLFPVLVPMIRPSGGVAVVTNGKPLWQLDSAWSRALRDVLSAWLGAPLDRTCGTDAESQRRYRDSLARAGFDVATASVDYADELRLEQVIGRVYSALPVDRLPRPEQRPDLAERIAVRWSHIGPMSRTSTWRSCWARSTEAAGRPADRRAPFSVPHGADETRTERSWKRELSTAGSVVHMLITGRCPARPGRRS